MPAVACEADGRRGARQARRGLPQDPLIRALVNARLEQDVTLEVLARRLGYHRNTIYAWENERYKPTLRAFIDWADSLGLEIRLITVSAESSVDA